MAKEKMRLKDAFIHVKKTRRIVCPNQGFVKQLIEYELEIFGANSVSIPENIQSYYGLHTLILRDYEMSGEEIEEELKMILND